MLDTALQRIGLSEKEAKVYLASLELGKSTAQKIAEKARVNRATTYVILESLIDKGVITVVEEGAKRFFVAAGPYALKNVIHDQHDQIEQKKAQLLKLFPKLKKVHNILPNRPVVKYYEGKEALQTIREQFLEAKNKEILSFYSQEEVANIFSDEDRKRYRIRRRAAGISGKVVYNPREQEGVRPAEEGVERRAVPKDKYSFPCDITIFDDHLSIAILSGSPSGILIESEAIADTFRSIFKLAYEASEVYDKELREKGGAR